MVLDWPRFWRRYSEFRELSIADCISKMNNDSAFSSYYDNAIKFTDFSQQHENWPEKIDREGITDILGYSDQNVLGNFFVI